MCLALNTHTHKARVPASATLSKVLLFLREQQFLGQVVLATKTLVQNVVKLYSVLLFRSFSYHDGEVDVDQASRLRSYKLHTYANSVFQDREN
jgi:hypothetical protein